MNKLEAKDLADKAKEYLDREIDVHVIEKSAQMSSKVTCIFRGWNTVIIGESNDPQNYQLTAKLENKENKNVLHYSALRSIIDQFKKLDE